MEERRILRYAKYEKEGRIYYQYLPTGKINDVIYVDGMKIVEEKSYIKDGRYYIDLGYKSQEFTIGESVSSLDLVKRYNSGDPLLTKKISTSTLANLQNNPDMMWTIYTCGNIEIQMHESDHHLKANTGEVEKKETPTNIIKGRTHWYIELHHSDGSLSHEKTLYNDKKYRGQPCVYYQFVKVCEYKVDDEENKAIIEREPTQFSYHPVEQTSLDDLIDGAKKIIFNEGKTYEGFAGVSPLYAFNTEDSASAFFDEQDKIKNGVVTTITGSGDANLDLFLRGADKIISFDVNSITRFYAELKFIAAKYLPFDEFKMLFSMMDETMFKKIETYLSSDTRRFWQELYGYVKNIDTKIKNWNTGGLFYPINSLFSANETLGNENGYYNETNYPKLQELLKNKSLDDIEFVTCDLLDLPTNINLEESTYVYLSNVMDFMIGVDKNNIDEESLKNFKYFILNILLPSLKKDAHIVVAYLRTSWHTSGINSYEDSFPYYEGFKIKKLPNGRDFILVYDPRILIKGTVGQNLTN